MFFLSKTDKVNSWTRHERYGESLRMHVKKRYEKIHLQVHSFTKTTMITTRQAIVLLRLFLLVSMFSSDFQRYVEQHEDEQISAVIFSSIHRIRDLKIKFPRVYPDKDHTKKKKRIFSMNNRYGFTCSPI